MDSQQLNVLFSKLITIFYIIASKHWVFSSKLSIWKSGKVHFQKSVTAVKYKLAFCALVANSISLKHASCLTVGSQNPFIYLTYFLVLFNQQEKQEIGNWEWMSSSVKTPQFIKLITLCVITFVSLQLIWFLVSLFTNLWKKNMYYSTNTTFTPALLYLLLSNYRIAEIKTS